MTAVARGCGTRVFGAIYSVCGVGSFGLPLEHFLYDPPQPVDVQKIGLSPVGTQLIDVGGKTHVLDWVGSEHYPNVADLLEEVRRFGLSRRLSSRTDFSRLGPGSFHILVHSKGSIDNWQEYQQAREEDYTVAWGPVDSHDEQPGHRCPEECVATFGSPVSAIRAKKAEVTARLHNGWPGDNRPDVECASLWWEDVTELYVTEPYDVHGRRGERRMPSFTYRAFGRPGGVKPKYSTALIARFPIQKLDVVKNPGDRAQEEEAVQAASSSGFPISLEDE